MTELLDGPLYYLNGARPEALEPTILDPALLDPALLTLSRGKAVLVFSDETLAREHLRALPTGSKVRCVEDLRAKEELFRASLARGADMIWLDAPLLGPPPASYPLQRALDYVLSFKRQSACL